MLRYVRICLKRIDLKILEFMKPSFAWLTIKAGYDIGRDVLLVVLQPNIKIDIWYRISQTE